jgi:molybdopterin-guanine dinucleotide biosynthesis protein MobB
MKRRASPPIISIVGRKNSGKTTFVVALAAELKRRGLRVASAKHGHHEFEIDHPGRDSWRHFHEGEVEAVLMISSGKIALVARAPEEPDPEALIRRHLGQDGYDLILVEGYKHGPFPKLEVHRSSVHDRPLHDPGDEESAASYLALVTDRHQLQAACPIIYMDPDSLYIARAADLIEDQLQRSSG